MLRSKMLKGLFLITLWGFAQQAWSIDFGFEKVADKVYAYVGPLSNRTPENLGLNNNIGLVVTNRGAVLIDSGAGNPSAKALEQAVKEVTQQPVVAIINTGSQDHRWLGNDYFIQKGATVYALSTTVSTQKSMASDLIENMSRVSENFADTRPAYAEHAFEQDEARVSVGDVVFEIKFLGDAHFPGDAIVWLPEQKVLFSGDLIYVDRILGVHPFSKVSSWQQAFHKAEALPAKAIVPGHGRVCDWEKARQDTGNYLDKLVERMSVAAEDMVGVEQTVSQNRDWPEFKHLEHYDSWHKTILNRTYLQYEQGL